jgi:hypothetical protein
MFVFVPFLRAGRPGGEPTPPCLILVEAHCRGDGFGPLGAGASTAFDGVGATAQMTREMPGAGQACGQSEASHTKTTY